ncbi:MAG TPA: uroporphyrinogen-III synthase [Actinocrinis sp.]|nr:uroporphyrinogen-III synthase [Actinocrinis sp.]
MSADDTPAGVRIADPAPAGPAEAAADPFEDRPLAGCVVAITADRRRAEFGTLLERRGARVVIAPTMRIEPLDDDSPLRLATEECLAGPLDYVVASTGIGWRGWISAAEGWGVDQRLLAACRAAVVLSRGPKATGAVRTCGLREGFASVQENMREILDWLLARDLAGARVAVQRHGTLDPGFLSALRGAGAEVIDVPIYRWGPPRDPAAVDRLVESIVQREVHAVAFTSAPGVLALLEAASVMGLDDDLCRAFGADPAKLAWGTDLDAQSVTEAGAQPGGRAASVGREHISAAGAAAADPALEPDSSSGAGSGAGSPAGSAAGFDPGSDSGSDSGSAPAPAPIVAEPELQSDPPAAQMPGRWSGRVVSSVTAARPAQSGSAAQGSRPSRPGNPGVLAACVGEVCAGAFDTTAVPARWPDRGRLGSLVKLIADELPTRLRHTADTPIGRIWLQGHAFAFDGEITLLAPQPAAVLRELVLAEDRVVSRADLLRRVWGYRPAAAEPAGPVGRRPNRAAADTGRIAGDHVLDVTVGRLRAALARHPGAPDSLIVTVPKRGYRLPRAD